MRYSKGDELILKVEASFGYSDKTYRPVKVQVIGFNVDCDGPDAEYLVYIPSYECMGSSFRLTNQHALWWDVDPKFIGDDVAFITTKFPIYKHVAAVPGERCDRCSDFFEGASRDDSGNYRCRACTINPWR